MPDQTWMDQSLLGYQTWMDQPLLGDQTNKIGAKHHRLPWGGSTLELLLTSRVKDQVVPRECTIWGIQRTMSQYCLRPSPGRWSSVVLAEFAVQCAKSYQNAAYLSMNSMLKDAERLHSHSAAIFRLCEDCQESRKAIVWLCLLDPLASLLYFLE